MTDEERDHLTAIDDPELRTWVRTVILERDNDRTINEALMHQHAERASRLRRIEAICKEPWS